MMGMYLKDTKVYVLKTSEVELTSVVFLVLSVSKCYFIFFTFLIHKKRPKKKKKAPNAQYFSGLFDKLKYFELDMVGSLKLRQLK